MKIPRGDSLIQRSLSNQNRGKLLIDKKPSERKKAEHTHIFSRNFYLEKNKEQENGILFDSTEKNKNPFNFLFYWQEFVTDWITQLAVRPTHLNTILSVIIYLIAISSTIQRREGTRWLQFLLQAKLPGYSTQYQETSWESFQNSTCKHLFSKTSNVNPYTFRKKKQECIACDARLHGLHGVAVHAMHACNAELCIAEANASANARNATSSFVLAKPPKKNGEDSIEASISQKRALEKSPFMDLYKDKAFIYLRSPWEKQIRKDFVGFFADRASIYSANDCISDACICKANASLAFAQAMQSSACKATLCKQASQQMETKPTLFEPTLQEFWSNQKFSTETDSNVLTVNKVDGSGAISGFSNASPDSLLKLEKNPIVLPWYRVDACKKWGKPLVPRLQNEVTSQNRNNFDKSTLYPDPAQITTDDNLQTNRKNFSIRSSNHLFRRRVSSRLALLNSQKNKVERIFNDKHFKNKIEAFNYILFLGKKKERISVENDSIPFKLESPYFTHNLYSNRKTSALSSDLSAKGVSEKNGENFCTEYKTSTLLPSTKFVSLSIIQNTFPGLVDNKGDTRSKFAVPTLSNTSALQVENLSFFQKKLRELYYLYGFTPPYDWTKLIDKKLTQSTIQVSKSSDKTEQSHPIEKLKHLEDDELTQRNSHSMNSTHAMHASMAKANASSANITFSEQKDHLHLLSKCIASIGTKRSLANNESAKQIEAMHSMDTDLKTEKKEINDNAVLYLLNQNAFFIHPEKMRLSHEELDLPVLNQKKSMDSNPVLQTNTNSDKETRNLNQTDNGENIENLANKTWHKQKKGFNKSIIPFTFKNWPLQFQANQFAPQGNLYKANAFAEANKTLANRIALQALHATRASHAKAYNPFNRFKRNNIIRSRFMSGYQFPDLTKSEIHILFKRFVVPHLLVSCGSSFAPSYLINQVVLRALYMKLPPIANSFFFKNLALSFESHAVSPNNELKPPFTISNGSSTLYKEFKNGEKNSTHAFALANARPNHEYSDINIEYKRITLQEYKQVKDIFSKLGRDFEEYLSLPKDSPPAIRISPSLQDDTSLQLQAEHKEKRDDERSTSWERLQKLRRREQKLELGKELRPFAYKNELAKKNENENKNNLWIDTKFGSQNMCSDRRYSFFGRKNLLTKRLVAQEQKELNDQILKDSYSVNKTRLISNTHPVNKINLKSEKKPQDTSIPKSDNNAQRHLEDNSFSEKSTNLLKDLPQDTSTNNVFTQKPAFLKEKIDLDKKVYKHSPQTDASNAINAQNYYKTISHKKLQRRARKGLIKLLSSPELSARNLIGAQNRTRKPNRALLGKVIPTAYSHLRWQKKRFSSRMLSTPSKRHLVMPEISHNDWNKILEWQLKNYFFLEEKRLEPLVKENPEKDFKVKQVHLYLPWVTIRTNSNKPFQWPLTRLDYADFVPWNASHNISLSFPLYKAVHYLDSGKTVSLSFTKTPGESKYKLLNSVKTFFTFKRLFGNSLTKKSGFFEENPKIKNAKDGTLKERDGIRTRTLNEPYLCEPLSNQSWLLIYRLFLAFTLKYGIKYIYRVSLKDFIIRMANSDFGLMMTSPEFREWLEHAPSQSLYTPFKRLQDVAAIEESIPTLSEMVWYLRNSGRGRTGCRGLLLVGPAGAEKTSVVQAIAGECGRPVIVQSMSALALSYQEPYEQLENVFALARKHAPCVLFLDNLDAIGQSRAHVLTNDVGSEDSLFSLDAHTAEGRLALTNCSNALHTSLLPKPSSGQTGDYLSRVYNPLASNPVYGSNVELSLTQEQTNNTTVPEQNGGGLSTFQQNPEFQARRLNLLLRLLTLMDGIAPLNGVLIVATSEQPAVLDPALVRAGRFERRVFLSLPNQERRIQLFKLATKKIGSMQSIPWNYFGLRTTNMSGADIASAINHSAIRAILNNSIHTVETLEHGLNCVTGIPNKRFALPILRLNQPFHYSRLAYYQSGRAIVYNLLPNHPQLGSCHLNEFVSNQSGNSGGSINGNVSTGGFTTMLDKQNLLLQRESLQVVISSPTFSKQSLIKDSGLHLRKQMHATVKHNLKSKENVSFNPIKNSIGPKKSYRIPIQKFYSNKTVQTQSNSSNVIKLRELGETTFSARTRVQFETRLVGLYAGKAAEMLHLSSNVVAENSLDLLTKYKATIQNSKSHLDSFSHSIFSKKFKKRSTEAWYWQSNLGLSDLLTASSLIHLMVDRWYLYSQKILHYKINRLVSSLNHEQLRDETLFPLAKRLSQELQWDSIKPNFWGITSDTSDHLLQIGSNSEIPNPNDLSLNKKIRQERIRTHWWQAKICQALEMGERPYGKWYRIYLPKIEEREQNEEWVPPDFIVHQSLALSNLTAKKVGYNQTNKPQESNFSSQSNADQCDNTQTRAEQEKLEQDFTLAEEKISLHADKNSKKRFRFLPLSFKTAESQVQHHNTLKTFNDLYLFERDHAYQNAVVNSFYEAFSILNENRELLDMFADHLIRYQILRAHEISKICSLFACISVR